MAESREAVTSRHLMPVVYYRRRLRDLFIKSFWTECVHCDKKLGPLPDPGITRMLALMAESERCGE